MIAIQLTSRQAGASRWDAFAGAGLLAWAVALALPHLPVLQRIWPGCYFRSFFGLPCGTCGFTRAFVRGARLDLAGALEASPLGALLFYAWVVASLWIAATWIVRTVRLPRVRFHPLLERFGPLALFLANWGWLLWRASRGAAAA